MRLLWRIVVAWHALVGRGPRWFAKLYLLCISAICRRLPHNAGMWIRNAVLGAGHFPTDLVFRPLAVVVGAGTQIRLTPHIGEFDAGALFSRRLDYEYEVFEWFEREAVQSYDLIVEIGANVGVYTVFLDRLIRAKSGHGGLRKIIAFEPAPEPFRRLVRNLDANAAATVTVFNAAVAETDGFLTLFEPPGHLTNGSLKMDFAEIFSDDVQQTTILACAAARLEPLLADYPRVLIKIDVESYEPELLAALEGIISRLHPDLLIEVLSGTPEAIAGYRFLDGYQKLLIKPAELESHAVLTAEPEHRDWLLRWPTAI